MNFFCVLLIELAAIFLVVATSLVVWVYGADRPYVALVAVTILFVVLFMGLAGVDCFGLRPPPRFLDGPGATP